jgi:hypothetical protein
LVHDAGRICVRRHWLRRVILLTEHSSRNELDEDAKELGGRNCFGRSVVRRSTVLSVNRPVD